MKTVITYGTFDLFHIGHLNLLERLRDLGDRLVVGVSTDEFNFQKGKKLIIPYAERARIVNALGCVDAVFPEKSWDQKRLDIVREHVDIFGMGSDWFGKFDHLADLCEIVYLPRTDLISTTNIKNILKKEFLDEIIAIDSSLTEVHKIIRKIIGTATPHNSIRDKKNNYL